MRLSLPPSRRRAQKVDGARFEFLRLWRCTDISPLVFPPPRPSFALSYVSHSGRQRRQRCKAVTTYVDG